MSNLYEERAGVYAQMTELREKGVDNWTADDTAKFTKIDTELNRLTGLIDAEARMASLSKAIGPPLTIVSSNSTQTVTSGNTEYRAAFDAYLRRGPEFLTSEQRAILTEARTMSTGIGSEGGYVVPDQTRVEIIKSLLDFGGMRGLVEVITTDNGQDIQFPTTDETAATGEWLAENEAAGDDDVAFGLKTLRAHIASSKTCVFPISLLEDANINVDQHVGSALGERIGRLSSVAWIHGTGAGQPTGLVFGRDTAKDVNITAAISFDNLQDLIRKVDPAYRRQGAQFVMKDATVGAIRKLKGSTNDHPIWQPALQQGDPDMILGYPLIIDAAMDADAATGGGSHTTGVPVLFGNFRAAYIIRDVKGIAVVRDPYGTYQKKRQVGMNAFLRTDGMVKNTGAYAGIERTS